MSTTTKLIAALLIPFLAVPAFAQAPVDAAVWRTFAAQLEVGAPVNLRLREGQRVSATLIQAGPDDLLVQPRTRRPVPVQHVPYEAILSIERDEARGMGVGKVVAIGVAAGVGTFLGILLLLAASLD